MQYRSIVSTAQSVAHKEGLRSFYVGVSSPMFGAAFSEALQFAMMTKVKMELANALGVDKLEKQQVMYCAMLTGVINSVVLNPVELVKIQM